MTPDDIAAFYPLALATARRLLPRLEDAEDAAQTTMLHAVRNAPRFRGDAAVTTWIGSIARNIARTERRRRRRKPLTQMRDADDRQLVEVLPAPDPGAEVFSRIARDVRILLALVKMAPARRFALQRHYLDGKPVASVAAEMGRTQAAVYSLLYAARRDFRDRYRALAA